MRKAAALLIAAVAVVGAGCGDDADVHARSSVASVPEGSDWKQSRGGSTLAAMIEESDLNDEPKVVTQPIGCTGCSEPAFSLVAYYERPGMAQSDVINEIQGMDIAGLSPWFLGLRGSRDGFMVAIAATTPDGDPGVMFSVHVLPEDMLG